MNESRRFTVAATACMLVGFPGPAFAQVPPGVDSRLISRAGRPMHGVSSIPADVRNATVADTALMDWFAALLTGERVSDAPWVPAIALWWLAQTGNPDYLPVFLEWANRDEADRGDQGAMVALGLARHASDPRAQRALLNLGRHGSAFTRQGIVGALVMNNDTLSRRLLRELRDESLLADRDSLVGLVLDAPPRYPSTRTAGCRTDERFGRDSAGAYACIPE